MTRKHSVASSGLMKDTDTLIISVLKENGGTPMRPIDADVLMEEVLKGTIISDDLYGMGIMTGVDSFAKKLKAAPTLTLDDLRPKGRWVMRGGKRYCSHCGERACVTRDKEDFWYTKGTQFCPACGANMRGYMSDGQRNQEG